MKLDHFAEAWGGLPHVSSTEAIVGVFIVFVFIAISINRNLRKEKINTFLFNNNYHSVNPKTSEILFPKVSFKKDRIVLKKCLRKTADQISQEKNLWEQAFSKEIGSKKIAGIEIRGDRITMSLV